MVQDNSGLLLVCVVSELPLRTKEGSVACAARDAKESRDRNALAYS